MTGFRITAVIRSVAVSILFLALLSPNQAKAQSALILVERDLSPPPRFALEDLKKSLTEKGLSVIVSDEKTAKSDILRSGIIEIKPTPGGEVATWEKQESYWIAEKRTPDLKHLILTGSDSVGLMYGIFALAEQVAMAPGNGETVWASLHETAGTPALAIRAENIFITLEDNGSISPWFYDEEFWKRYFATLARNRFNLCDIHAMYSLTETSFPNLFPYFLKRPAMPEAALASENQARNLAMFKRIIDLAEERGVHVALMNYATDFPGIDAGDEKQLIEQTSWAVSELLRQCPKLWMFGFRIGESGRSEDFFKTSYLDGIARSGKRNMRLYTRTWLAQFKDLTTIGMRYPENFYIEVKYNGEHLGAPYHAIQGRWGSYSYEKYLNYPRYWKILWQVRANGTHRLFPWCDAEFVRRCIRSCSFGDAVGFTLEPITAYYPQEPTRYFKDPEQVDFIRYQFERHWAWHLVWGRLAYDPDTADSVIVHYFKQRFGVEKGDKVHRLANTASKIMPLIYRHHCLGPDHRDMAPEFETGNGTDYVRHPEQVHDIDSFAQSEVLDQQSYLSPAGYVDAYLAQCMDGKITPIEAAQRLEDLAQQCLDLLQSIRVSPQEKELAALATDVRALCELARYYAEKDRAACALQFYYKTGDASRAVAARKYLEQAIAYWKGLAEIAAQQYRALLDPLRVGRNFTWRKVMPDLDADLRRVTEVEKEIARSDSLQLGHIPVYQAKPGRNLALTIGASGISAPKVTLHYSIGSGTYSELPSIATDRWAYQATIPGAQLGEGDRLRYWFTVSKDNVFVMMPKTGANKPYEVTISSDTEGPRVAWCDSTIKVDRQANRLHVECTINDPSGVAWARVEWKPMPSDQPWAKPVAMASKDEGDVFAADIPLTHEGVLYSVVAADRFGNVTRYPDARFETPYVAVNPWDRGLPPEMRITSPGLLTRRVNFQTMNWEKVSSMGRPGEFYEYRGNDGRVDFSFSVNAYSDCRMTIATVVKQDYGAARVLIDGNEVGILNCQQDVGGYVPVQKDFYVRGLEARAHTLSFELRDTSAIGIEGFHFVAMPAMVDGFFISQSFPGYIGAAGKDMYPIGKAEIVWKPAEVDECGVVHLDAQLKPNQNCHAYAATTLVCDKSITTNLLVGSNDGVFVWLNGELVHSYPEKRAFRYNQDRIPIKLAKGKNLLVLMVLQAGRSWAFNVNLESYDFTLQPPDFVSKGETK